MKNIQLRALAAILLRAMAVAAMCLPWTAEAAGKPGRKRPALDAPTSDSGLGDKDPGPKVETIREGVTGIVLDVSGAPLAGVLVQPTSLGRGGPVPEMAVMSGPDGRFTWRLGPGHYRFDAITEGGPVASANVTVTRGALSNIQLRAGK